MGRIQRRRQLGFTSHCRSATSLSLRPAKQTQNCTTISWQASLLEPKMRQPLVKSQVLHQRLRGYRSEGRGNLPDGSRHPRHAHQRPRELVEKLVGVLFFPQRGL
jgi:hypothetical protein